MGGVQLIEPHDLREKQLYHVVEEMALASGLPLPKIFILPNEDGLNAVTAGRSQANAVIMVTQGAMDHFSRDELQAVIAHEFAHILNEDSSLNLQMSGFLFGLLCFFVVGRDMTRAVETLADNLDARMIIYLSPVLLIGILLMIGGWLGKASAELIQAAFSRQREYLADAFAAQFTRNPKALADALKRVAAFSRRGAMRSSQALMMKSFFIVSPNLLTGLFGSHPPIKKRIKLLDPQWDGRTFDLPASGLKSGAAASAGKDECRFLLENYYADRIDAEAWNQVRTALGGLEPSAGSLRLAACLLDVLPEKILSAAGSPARAPALAAALFLHKDSALASAQRQIIADLMGEHVAEISVALADDLNDEIRLPVLDLLLPALSQAGWEGGYKLYQTAQALARADDRLDFFEVAALLILQKHLQINASRAFPADVGAQKKAVVNLLSIMAYVGADTPEAAAGAFSAGLAGYDDGRIRAEIAPAELSCSNELARSLGVLQSLPRLHKKKLIAAAALVAGHDRLVTVSEYELLRSLAAALDLPLPMFAMEKPAHFS